MTPSKTFLSYFASFPPPFCAFCGTKRRAVSSPLSLLLWLGPASEDTQLLIWGSISPVQTQCKSALNSRGYKALFQGSHWSPLSAGRCKGTKPLPPFQLLLQDGNSCKRLDPLTSPCSIPIPATCLYSTYFDLVSGQLSELSYLR